MEKWNKKQKRQESVTKYQIGNVVNKWLNFLIKFDFSKF